LDFDNDYDGECSVSLFIKTLRRKSKWFNEVLVSVRKLEIVSEILLAGCGVVMLAYDGPELDLKKKMLFDYLNTS